MPEQQHPSSHPFTVTLVPSQTSFGVEPGETVLEAARRSHIVIPYSCGTGRCLTCAARLVSGKAEADVDAHTLGGQKDEILTCRARPSSDLVVAADYFPELAHLEARRSPAKINWIKPLPGAVIALSLRLPPRSALKSLPGQYINLTYKGHTRAYSVAEASQEGRELLLHIKVQRGGQVSEALARDAKPDDLVHAHGPHGTFFLRQDTDPIIFLCTGTGFAPVRAMVESLLQAGDRRQIAVYWGQRHGDEFYDRRPWSWRALGKNISFHAVCSRDPRGLEHARVGYVQDAALEDFQGELSGVSVYACGSDAMIQSARQTLSANGLRQERFYSDAFVSGSEGDVAPSAQ